MKKRLLVGLLILIFTISCVACHEGGAGGDETGVESVTGTVGTSSDETEDSYLSSLPDVDYNNADVRILISTQMEPYFSDDAESEEIIGVASYRRNLMVEEDYGVNLEYTSMDGNATGATVFVETIRAAATSGDHVYDIVSPQSYGSALILEGAYANLADSPYLHFEQPWWIQTINDHCTLQGKLYGVAGSYTMDKLVASTAVYYNVSLMKDFNLGGRDEMYQMVTDGAWTYEKFYTMVSTGGLTQDLNHDGVMDADDQYGLACDGHAGRLLMNAANLPITTKTEDGEIEVIYMSDRLTEVYESYRSLINDNAFVYRNDNTGKMQPVFFGGRALLCITYVGSSVTENFRNMTDEYGIVPVPKYDENQKNYVSGTQRWELNYIMNTTADFDRSCIILEALNYQSHKIMVPAFWDECLQYKFNQDPRDFEMLNIVRSSIYYDFTECFQAQTGSIYSAAGSCINKNVGSFSTWYDANIDTVNLYIQMLLATIATLE